MMNPLINIVIVISFLVCQSGTLSQYAQQPTDRTLAARSTPGRTAHTLPLDRAGIDGYVAVSDCADIGRVVTVWAGGRRERKMIFDCAGDAQTREWMRRGGVIGELDYYTAQRWGVLGRSVKNAMMCWEE